ncbi:MAG: esterase [Bdellovibrio sp. ArHS]|nr:MAG: esterase [Bdellovibrio sp. ArHS]
MNSIAIEFTERMSGFVVPKKLTLSAGKGLSHSDFQAENDRFDKQPFEFTVTIKVPNLENFLKDHGTPSQVFGKITDFRFREELRVENGYFQLFTSPSISPDFATVKEMHYTLFLTDREGKKWTFFGFKELLKEELSQVWKQTTTLYYYLWEGHSLLNNYGDKEVHAIGSLRISPSDFLTQMKSFKTNAATFREEKEALLKYFKAFTDTLWESYAPYIFTTTSARWNEHPYPVHTTQGVALGENSLHPLDTRDGLTISLQRFRHQDSKDVVLLLHGLTTSTDMFIMPEHQNLVNHLHTSGYPDVWSLDWRGSGRFTYNMSPHRYTIDDVAKFDIPRAVEFIRESCGADVRIHVVAHCVGALSFMASLATGQVRNIASVIANSVSLTPKVPWQALAKMRVGPEIFEQLLGYPYVSPAIPYFPARAFGRWIYWMERGLRSECKEPACHMVSFMWGWGFPAAFNHRNIHPVTHRRLKDLFGGTSFHYHKHIRKMLLTKASVSFDGKVNYLEESMKKDLPPILLISGTDNQIFPGANKATYEILSQTKNAAKVTYKEFTNYGHQDVFMGQFCHAEVFPELIAFIKQHSGTSGIENRKLRIA